MTDKNGLYRMDDKIQTVKALLLELEDMGQDFPALLRNAKRALASVKMLEFNISDVINLLDDGR